MSDTIEAAHSNLGPSSAERWLVCAASVRASEGIADKDSAWALEGTSAHTLSEWSRAAGKPAKHWLGKQIAVMGVDGTTHNFTVDAEMANAVQEFVDYVEALGGEQLNESRIRYEEYVPGGFGTLDAAAMFPGHGVIVDYKHGKGVQKFAEWNPQLLLYAFGIYLLHDWLYGFERFTLVISQPRLDHLDEWEISTEDLLKWVRDVLVPGYEATLSKDAPFVPGEHCRFCRLKATCRARAEQTFNVVQNDFEDLTDARVDKKPAELSLEELGQLREHFADIKSWMAAADAKVFEALRVGQKVGELKIVEGRSDRMFAPDAEKQLLKKGFKKAELYEDPRMKTPAALEKLRPEVKRLFAPATKTKPAGDLFNVVVKPKGKLTIAPGTDKRPAVVIFDLENEFENLNQGDDE